MTTDTCDQRTSIAVYVGTYKRNEALVTVLDSVLAAATTVADCASVAMIVIDDNPTGDARPVVDSYEGKFERGIHYHHVGRGNISLVRNAGLEAGLALGDWVAMTDDDCEVKPDWLAALLDTAVATGADAVTGTCFLRVPPGSPAWLSEQPFFEEERIKASDGAAMEIAATNNSMISSAWLAAHPDVRFDPELGVLGGEDMVFFGTARRAGLSIRFSDAAAIWGNESTSRATFKYRMRSAFWLGNTICVTNLRLGAVRRSRLLIRGFATMARSMIRPIRRMSQRNPAQWRFTAALLAQATGSILGAFGFRKAHH